MYTIVYAFDDFDMDVEKSVLSALPHKLVPSHGLESAESRAVLREADALMVTLQRVTAEVLDAMPKCKLVSRLGVLLGHLLKWELQPERRSRSWFLSVREQRRAITRLLEQNPSLRSRLEEALEDGFQAGVDLVLRETELALRTLPQSSPWSLAQALDPQTLCDTRGDWSDLSR